MIEHRADCPVASGGEGCTCLELTPVRPRPEVRWDIPKNVWVVLVGWGLAVLILAGLFSLRMEMNQRSARERDAEQDRAMCELVTSIQGGPSPPPGPAGDRARDIITKIDRVRKATCEGPQP